MRAQRRHDTTIEELRRDLQDRSAQGAGLAELLAEVERRHGRRFSLRPGRLSADDVDDLRRYCWSLHHAKPKDQLFGRARELWGGSATLRTTRLGYRSPRRGQSDDWPARDPQLP